MNAVSKCINKKVIVISFLLATVFNFGCRSRSVEDSTRLSSSSSSQEDRISKSISIIKSIISDSEKFARLQEAYMLFQLSQLDSQKTISLIFGNSASVPEAAAWTEVEFTKDLWKRGYTIITLAELGMTDRLIAAHKAHFNDKKNGRLIVLEASSHQTIINNSATYLQYHSPEGLSRALSAGKVVGFKSDELINSLKRRNIKVHVPRILKIDSVADRLSLNNVTPDSQIQERVITEEAVIKTFRKIGESKVKDLEDLTDYALGKLSIESLNFQR